MTNNLVREIDRLASRLTREATDSDPHRRADATYHLWMLHQQIGKALDRARDQQRAEALVALNHVPGVHTTEGDVGKVTVTVPPTTLRVAKGADINALRRTLGAEFDIYFESDSTYRPRPDFEEALLQAPEHVRDLLFSALEQKADTPQVTYSRRKS